MSIGDKVLTIKAIGKIPAGSQGKVTAKQGTKVKVLITHLPDCKESSFPLPWKDEKLFKSGSKC